MMTMLGVFTDKDNVTEAINALRDRGFDPKNISIVMKDREEAKEIKDDTGVGVAGGAVSGATTGAIVGGLAGLLASFVIPGLGAFFIGGPIAAALGLTGAAASTVSGATTGAVAGGLLGALMGFGLNEDEAKHYESRVKEGATLLAIPVDRSNETEARNVLEDYKASDIKTFTQESEMIHNRPADKRYADMETRTIDSDDADLGDVTHTYTSAGAKGGTARTHRKTGDLPSDENDSDDTDETVEIDEEELT